MSHNIPEKFGIYASEKLKLVKGAKFAEPRIPNSPPLQTDVSIDCRSGKFRTSETVHNCSIPYIT